MSARIERGGSVMYFVKRHFDTTLEEMANGPFTGGPDDLDRVRSRRHVARVRRLLWGLEFRIARSAQNKKEGRVSTPKKKANDETVKKKGTD